MEKWEKKLKEKPNSEIFGPGLANKASDDLIIEIVGEDLGEISLITIIEEAERENQERKVILLSLQLFSRQKEKGPSPEAVRLS